MGTNDDRWTTIHAERQALATDLGGLNDEQWDTPSLCAGWTVRDTLAHMTATAKITPGAFFGKLIASGLRFTKLQSKDIAVERGSSPADTLARFATEVSSSKHPPGPGDTWMGEVIIHAEDIRRPLGIKHDYPKYAAVSVADFYKGSNLVVGAKRRIAGLHLTAIDADWSHGTGPEVRGPIVSLVLVMTGRTAGIDDLEGDGVGELRARS